MIMIMTMIMTMTMICFFSFRAIVYKILVRTMLLVRADLQRKVIGVFVPLDLRVRFAKEVTITSVLISRGLQQFNGKTLYIYFFFFNDNLFLVICVFFCSDINECARGLYKCNSDAFCNNIKGSYNCICKSGFTGRECKGKRWGRNVVENQLIKSLSKNFDTLAIALLFFWALQPL